MQCKACNYKSYQNEDKGHTVKDPNYPSFKLITISKSPDLMTMRIGAPSEPKLDELYACPKCGTVRYNGTCN